MIAQVYSIFDSVSEVFLSPFFQKNDGEAIRTFQRICDDPNTMMHSSPADYRLMHLGSFDDNLGRYSSLELVRFVCSGRRSAPVVASMETYNTLPEV